MKIRKAVSKAVFSIIVATIVLAVMVPFLSFLVTAFYSANEIYTVPRSLLPKTSYDVKVEYIDDLYYVSVYEDSLGEYELKIYSAKIDKLRRYLQTRYSVMLTDEEVEADFAPSQNGEPIYLQYKKDLLYNFKTFFHHHQRRGTLGPELAYGRGMDDFDFLEYRIADRVYAGAVSN